MSRNSGNVQSKRSPLLGIRLRLTKLGFQEVSPISRMAADLLWQPKLVEAGDIAEPE